MRWPELACDPPTPTRRASSVDTSVAGETGVWSPQAKDPSASPAANAALVTREARIIFDLSAEKTIDGLKGRAGNSFGGDSRFVNSVRAQDVSENPACGLGQAGFGRSDNPSWRLGNVQPTG